MKYSAKIVLTFCVLLAAQLYVNQVQADAFYPEYDAKSGQTYCPFTLGANNYKVALGKSMQVAYGSGCYKCGVCTNSGMTCFLNNSPC
jgi:hypothetical protein